MSIWSRVSLDHAEGITPFQARVNCLGFIAFAVGICVNALYFQEGHSGNKSRNQTKNKQIELERSQNKPKQKEQYQRVVSTQSLPDDKSATSLDKPGDVVSAIQRELTEKGYQPEKDGSAGLITRAAILAYEYDMGLRLTASPSDKVLQNIIFGVERRRTNHQAPVSKSGQKIIRVVQKVLVDIGFDPGPVNGNLSEKTKRAIRKFEKVRDLKVTGRVSGRLIRELIDYTQSPIGG